MLPVRVIHIRRSEYMKLEKGGYDFVRAGLEADGKRESVHIRYRGGHTRHYPKKSYEIRVGTRIIHYNAELDDPAMMRNAMSFYFFNQLGVPSPRTRHVQLVINGASQGVYLEIEGVDRAFFAKRGMQVSALLYAGNNNANFRLTDEHGRRKSRLSSGYEVIIGGAGERRRIAELIRRLHTLGRRELPAYLLSRLHLSQYLKWLAGAVATGNYDGFEQNYALYRIAGSGKYGISPWDYEGSWGRDCYGKLAGSRTVRITGYNGLTEKLLQYPAIRREYKKLLQRLLKNQFTVAKLQPVIRRMNEALLPELLGDASRRHSAYEIASDADVFIRYIRERRAYLAEELSKL